MSLPHLFRLDSSSFQAKLDRQNIVPFYLYALQLLPLTLYSETANPYQPASSVF